MTLRYILVAFFILFGVAFAQATHAQSAFFLTSSKQTVRELREVVTLNWDATALDAEYCEAMGHWKGRRAVMGMESVRPWIDGNYYSLKCFPKDHAKKPVTLSTTVDVDKSVLPEYGGFPAIDIVADPSDVEEGGTTTLSWDAKGADYCFGYHGSAFQSTTDIQDEWSDARGLDPKGSLIIHPRKSGRYQISCQQLTKTSSYANSADVYISVGPKKPTITLSVSRQNIERGASVDITWTAPQAENCYALAYVPTKDGYYAQVDFASSWNGTNLSSQGLMRLSPFLSTQYYLNCTWKNEKGEKISQRAATKVIVTQQGIDTAPKPVPLRKPMIISFSAEPLTVMSGEKVTAYWNAKDAEVCTFLDFVVNGLGADDKKKKLALSGSNTFIPLKSGRYGVVCTAETYSRGELELDYVTTARDEEWVDIVVTTPEILQKKQDKEKKDITITFTTNKELVPKGKTAYLEWSAENATACVSKGPKGWSGSRPTRGSFEVRPDYSTTYQLQCINDSVSPATKKTAEIAIGVVSVAVPSWLTNNISQKPLIDFEVTKTEVEKKEAVTFSWIASYAEQCRGEGPASAWQTKKQTTGSHTLYLQSDYEVAKPYRLICSNRNGTTISKDIRVSFKKNAKKK